MQSALFDAIEVRKTLTALLAPGQVTELRILGGRERPNSRASIIGGFFDDPEALVDALGRLAAWTGAYITLNPVDPALLSRRRNRIDYQGAGGGASDANIVARRWLPLDIDPARPKGIASTDDEHAAALALARRIRDDLASEGWPAPILADSGNGAHLLYRCDLPAVSDLPKRWLAAMKARYETPALIIDGSIFNPARIWKLYGTLACKGDSDAKRPWRFARTMDSES